MFPQIATINSTPFCETSWNGLSWLNWIANGVKQVINTAWWCYDWNGNYFSTSNANERTSPIEPAFHFRSTRNSEKSPSAVFGKELAHGCRIHKTIRAWKICHKQLSNHSFFAHFTCFTVDDKIRLGSNAERENFLLLKSWSIGN